MKRVAASAIAALALAWDAPALPQEGWRAFAGSWSAEGPRETLPTEGGGEAATFRFSGTVVLTAGDGLGRGFLAEAIGFDDGASVRVGRCVWTDDRGDRIFSELRGEPVETGRRFFGRITGGTGRYAGITGEYEFTWQYVVRDESGTVQGRTTNLTGRYAAGPVPR